MTPPRDPVAAVTHPDPYPYYGDLAVRRPICRDDRLGLWVVAGAGTVSEVLASDACAVRPAAEPVPRALEGSAAGAVFGRLVRMNDGDDHRRMRQAVAATLASVDAADVAATARLWTGLLLDRAGAPPDGAAVDRFLFHLPVYVMGTLLGVPPRLLCRTAAWMADFVCCLSPLSSAEQIARSGTAADELRAMFAALLAPGCRTGGLLWRLRDEADRAGCADRDAVTANAVGFLSQPYEATAGLIGNLLLALHTHGEARRRVAAEPGLFPDFVQEVLRHDPAVHNTRRYVVRDTEIAGHAVGAGETILVVLAAANRDPAANPAPERFELDRADRRTFTFGGARHACPGDRIAATIAAAAAAGMATAIGDLAGLARQATYRPSVNTRIPVFSRAA